MARTPRITAEMLLEAGAAITLEKGADALNVRSVAAKLNCSVQPVFRNFGSMETFRRAVIEYLDGTYQSFVAQYLDKSDYLFTISLAHILLARDRRNLFGVLFLSNEHGSRTVPQIISSPWNREAIDCTAVQYGLTVKEAEAVYFYTFGIAEALYAGSLIAEENELRQLLRGAIRKFCAK